MSDVTEDEKEDITETPETPDTPDTPVETPETPSSPSAVEDMQDKLKEISDVNDTLVKNRVARFAYTQEAYRENIADGVAEYKVANQQNIPIGTEEVLNVNSTVLSKGYRSQASSLTRNLMNHFLGRLSYNANKLADNMKSVLDFLKERVGKANGIATLNENGSVEREQLKDYQGTANGFATLNENKTLTKSQIQEYLGAENGIASLDETGRIPFEQLPESAIELKGTWNAETNTPELKDGVGVNGDMYIVAVSGTQDLGHGEIYYAEGNRVLFTSDVNEWTQLKSGSVFSVAGNYPSAEGNVALGDLKFEVVGDETVASVGEAAVSFKDEEEHGTVKVSSSDTNITVESASVSVNIDGNKPLDVKGTENGVEVSVDAKTTMTGSVHINANSDANGNIVIGEHSLQDDLNEDKGNKGNIVIGSNSLVERKYVKNSVIIGSKVGSLISPDNNVLIGNATNAQREETIIIGNNTSTENFGTSYESKPFSNNSSSYSFVVNIPCSSITVAFVDVNRGDDASTAYLYINNKGSTSRLELPQITGDAASPTPEYIFRSCLWCSYNKEKNTVFLGISFYKKAYVSFDGGYTWSFYDSPFEFPSTGFCTRFFKGIYFAAADNGIACATQSTVENKGAWSFFKTNGFNINTIDYSSVYDTLVFCGTDIATMYATFSVSEAGEITLDIHEAAVPISVEGEALIVCNNGSDDSIYLVGRKIGAKDIVFLFSSDGGKTYEVLQQINSSYAITSSLMFYNQNTSIVYFISSGISGNTDTAPSSPNIYTWQHYGKNMFFPTGKSVNYASSVTDLLLPVFIDDNLYISGSRYIYRFVKEQITTLYHRTQDSIMLIHNLFTRIVSDEIGVDWCVLTHKNYCLFCFSGNDTVYFGFSAHNYVEPSIFIGNDITLFPTILTKAPEIVLSTNSCELSISSQAKKMFVRFNNTDWQSVLTSSSSARSIAYSTESDAQRLASKAKALTDNGEESIFDHIQKLEARIDELEAQIATGSSATGYAAQTNAKIASLESSISSINSALNENDKNSQISKIKSSISTAQSTASSASANAATAQSTADSALSKANAANTALNGYSFT